MSKSSDPGHFFQTTSSLEEGNRKAAKSYNTFGDPIKLPSKLLAIIPDPVNEHGIYVAESAGTVKRIDLSTKEVTHTFVGPAAPVSCICIHVENAPEGTVLQTLFAGCWDKQIWLWDIPSAKADLSTIIKSDRRFQGHRDFVKALTVLSVPGQTTAVLVSGGAESEILFWDIKTGGRLHVLKGHTRGILDLKLDPSTVYAGAPNATLYSADSSREIRICSIPTSSPISTSSLKSVQLSPPLVIHETSVYSIHFDPTSSDLWTCSADKTAKHLSRRDSDGEYPVSPTSSSLEPSAIWLSPDTTLQHPDFVRSIVTHPTIPIVATACRDENIRLWNPSTGKLIHIYEGHYEEVTGLCIRGKDIISVSIDGTVRRWDVTSMGIEEYKKEKERLEKGESLNNSGVAGGGGDNLLTEEEERELAELMAETED
ncbi:putative wd repeat protein [Phaeomoniella chlamydospora]|uniref:Putative wd repeat protein n=1 Tax=Phaeomoniella chlamydospora TaxID=158046 RepID=A0A0G2E7Z1_PHACM|nr:putative wd repeat protein [Phaeomoniella chlamydospora]